MVAVTERKASQLMANVCFQTAPKTRLPACRWRRTEAESSPWSAAAAQTPQFRVTSGSESGTASRRLETRLCWTLLRRGSISAAPPTNTEARTLPLSPSGSEVSSRLGGHGNSPCPLPYASSVSAINCSNGMDRLSTPTSYVVPFRKRATSSLCSDRRCRGTHCDRRRRCCEVRFL